jgi:hypothetical protein
VLLLLKLFLAPALIAVVTLAARRWGPRVGGWLTGLPSVAGPTLCFYAFEQGPRFAANAAHGTLLGLVAVPGFCLAYAYSGRRAPWPRSLLTGWGVFILGAALLTQLGVGVVTSWILLAGSCAAGYLALPLHSPIPAAPAHSRWDLPLRMLTAAVLVVALTAVADRLGPELSGLLAPFPVATAIVAVFTHTQRGIESVIAFFRGFLPALVSFGLFCLVLALTLERVELVVALTLALTVQLTIQTFTIWGMTRAGV